MVFVDSSALVAMTVPEADGPEIAEVLDRHPRAVTSPLAVFETVLALCRVREAPVSDMTLHLENFLQAGGIDVVAMDARLHLPALRAHEAFGKGTGHPARLNMGDCFSYAMAKQLGMPLLYKGDDFSHTDLA
jgi:ribonuclease VapC